MNNYGSVKCHILFLTPCLIKRFFIISPNGMVIFYSRVRLLLGKYIDHRLVARLELDNRDLK